MEDCPNCIVTRKARTREQIATEVIARIREALALNAMARISEESAFADLGLTGMALRRVEYAFYTISDAPLLGDFYDCADSALPPVPPTVRELVDRVFDMQYDIIDQCPEHRSFPF